MLGGSSNALVGNEVMNTKISVIVLFSKVQVKTCLSGYRKGFFLLSTLLILNVANVAMANELNSVPRTVLAFYDSTVEADISTTNVHEMAEMPLNHLGLKVHYQDINDPLPDENEMRNVQGILLWFNTDAIARPNAFLSWMITQMHRGKRVVIMGSHAFENVSSDSVESIDEGLLDQFWQVFGLSQTVDWVAITYDIKFEAQSASMTGFERTIKYHPPMFPIKKVQDSSFKSYLNAYRKGADKTVIAELILTGPKGGYVAPGYSIISLKNGKLRYWYINPFQFFREAFNTDAVPKADTTTLAGRRIYYSHVDGDGWRSLSLMPGYREYKKTVTEVLLHEIFEKYTDLPVTVAPVAADLDKNWFGTEESQRLAREIFALPHVEAGSHTFSHPLEWTFFEDYEIESEEPYLESYPKATKTPGINLLFGYKKKKGIVMPDSVLEADHKVKLENDNNGKPSNNTVSDKNLTTDEVSKKQEVKKKKTIRDHYDVPRAYYTGPFDIRREIQGSVDTIEQFLPSGKQVKLLQWSGDTRPYAKAIEQTRQSGLLNLNGGDSRLDKEFDSYSWVAPLGREVGGQRQIYSSSSNENTYTNLWESRFYGYGYLEQTLRRTETPWRLKPINVYYHNYSGERLASVNALRKIFFYARSQKITPISASKFSAIAEGFYNTEFIKLDEQSWRIKNRGQLQTIRFDQAGFSAIDFSRSQGVIGQTHYQGSLYVYLDAVNDSPVISLKQINSSHYLPEANRPYLIDGRWTVKALEINDDGFLCQVQGFGGGEMKWYMPVKGRYRIYVEKDNGKMSIWEKLVDDEQVVSIVIGDSPVKPYRVKVELL